MFVAGPYQATFGGAPIGQVEDGFFVEYEVNGEPIIGDYFGDQVQDVVFRGGNVYVSFTLLEFIGPAVQALLWPWGFPWSLSGGSPGNSVFGANGVPGQLMSIYYRPLVLQAIPPFTTATPATWTFFRAGIAPGFNVRLLLAPRLRRVPLRLLCLPHFYNGSAQTFMTSVAAGVDDPGTRLESPPIPH